MNIKHIARRTQFFGISLLILSSCTATTIKTDLSNVPMGKGWSGDIENVKQLKKDDSVAIGFKNTQKGKENIAWLDGLEFKSGIIEFDAKGKTSPRQSSFVGVAFRVADNKTYDVVYFRPFNFNSDNSENKSHAVQYMSEPEWPWYKLRDNKSGQYEKPINPAPDGDDWFHVKLVIKNRQVKAYVNNASEPSLVVNELTERTAGSVGIWSIGYGMIANLQITPEQ